MNLELTDEQKEALIRELSPIIDGDRYPFSPRIRVLKEVLGQLQPEPTRPAPLPRDGITSRRATGDTRDGVRVMATTPRRQQSNPIASAFEGWTIWPESEPGYFAELGRMIAAYARAEAGVHYLARHLSGLPDAKARAIFGRMRLPDLTDLIRQMMRINKTSDDIYQEVDACLVQLDTIAQQRHKLVHRMVEYAGSYLSVSNPLTAKSVVKIESDVFSLRNLENMNLDC